MSDEEMKAELERLRPRRLASLGRIRRDLQPSGGAGEDIELTSIS